MFPPNIPRDVIMGSMPPQGPMDNRPYMPPQGGPSGIPPQFPLPPGGLPPHPHPHLMNPMPPHIPDDRMPPPNSLPTFSNQGFVNYE